jgi:hypothetical protein
VTLWEDLAGICKPTVVFVCLGLNDGQGHQPSDELTQTFKKNLSALIDHIRKTPTVRLIIVLSPPHIQAIPGGFAQRSSYNKTVKTLAQAAGEVAADKKAVFGDLFSYTEAANAIATKNDEGMSFQGSLPNEFGNMVVAAFILRGIGASAQELDAVVWSPLKPRPMVAYRRALGMQLKAPSLEASDLSRDLYDNLHYFNNDFFRAWRIADRHPMAPKREAVLEAAEASWGRMVDKAKGIAEAAKSR